jgi:hypothetical protein
VWLKHGQESLLDMDNRTLGPYLGAINRILMRFARDVIYLDMALEVGMRGLVESRMAELREAAGDPRRLPLLLRVLGVCVEGVCASLGSNQELLLCLKDVRVGGPTPLRWFRAFRLPLLAGQQRRGEGEGGHWRIEELLFPRTCRSFFACGAVFVPFFMGEEDVFFLS